MAKVLRVVATVASVLAVIPGPWQPFAMAIAVTAGIGASLLAKKPPSPRNSAEALNRLRANIDPRTPRKTVVGITAMATDIRDEEFTDDQAHFHRFIVCASHKVESIDEIWFDDKVAWTAGGGIQGEFAGYLTVAVREEGSAANAINISARMGATRRYTGLAYVHLRYKLTGNSKTAESPFAQSVTTRITIRGKGAHFYDSRLDSTVAGGSGAHRADDQSTWAWDDDACRNPALALLFYLLGYRITNPVTSQTMLAVGKGIPPARINLESFAVAANLCDEMVDDGNGGTEPRYRADGVWSEGDSPTTVIDMLKASMNADLDDVDGKLRLTVFHNDLATPDADFTDADILDAFEWEQTPPLDETFNIVRGVFTDPSDTSLYQPIDYPQVEIASPDGIDRIDTFDLPLVQRASQAQRLARLRLARQEHGGGTFAAEWQATAWKVQKNSVVRQTFGPTGFVQKLFRVAEMDIRVDGRVPMVLREESADIYDPPTLQAPVDPIASTPWDYTKDPVVSALAASELSFIMFSSQSLAAQPTATDTSITIPNHDRIYSDKIVPVTGDTIGSLSASTRYYLYYDDIDRQGGAVTWIATTDFEIAQTAPTNPGRHYGGYITTDTPGGTGTSGGGSLPPGSGGSNPYPP